MDKEQKKEYRRQYYLAHKQEEKDSQKRRYWEDPERARKKAEEYRIKNPEKIKEIKKKTRLKNRNKNNKLNKIYYQTHRPYLVKEAGLRNKKRLYNISPIDYEKLLEKKNKCNICKTPYNGKRPFTPCIDHCHKSGIIRGLLCFNCNSALGFFNDNTNLIEKAIKWLSRNKDKYTPKKPHTKYSPTKLDYNREYNLIFKYGISLKEKEEILKEQNNRCGVCNKKFSDKYPLIPCIDHCHNTGIIRGILCKKCNLGLGLFKDNTENLKNAQLWLQNKGEGK